VVASRTLNLFARKALVALDVPVAVRAGEFEFTHKLSVSFCLAASVPKPIHIAASPINAKCETKKAQKSLEMFLSLFPV
jgi:hypothetical protein